MSYIPDCRTDEVYNEKNLKPGDVPYIRGYDWCTEAANNAFDNLDSWEHDDLDVRPSDIEKVAEAFKPFLLQWIESNRNEAITSIIDGYSGEET